MVLTVNGKKIDFAGKTVIELVESYRLDRESIVVEKNREIVQRDTYEQVFLADGDIVEIVRFVGGG